MNNRLSIERGLKFLFCDRPLSMTERFKLQIRVEAMNATNHPHFGNPGANVSNLQLNNDGSVKSLNGFSQITSLQPLSRLIDPRCLRLGARITFCPLPLTGPAGSPSVPARNR